MAEELPASVLETLGELTRWLAHERIPATIIGGVAASLLGRPRLTQDIDVLVAVPERDWARAVHSAAAFGIVPRIPDALEFARRSRVLLMHHSRSRIDIDITFSGLRFEQAAIEHARPHEIAGTSVPLPRVEDLLVMKAIARRPKDLEDIRGLLEVNPQANTAEVRRWVREFSVAAAMPDLLQQFDALLATLPPKS